MKFRTQSELPCDIAGAGDIHTEEFVYVGGPLELSVGDLVLLSIFSSDICN